VDADEFGWLRALDRYEPIGREAEILATGFAVLANLTVAAKGGRGRFESVEMMPPGTIRPEPPAAADDAAAAEARMAEVARAEAATRGQRR